MGQGSSEQPRRVRPPQMMTGMGTPLPPRHSGSPGPTVSTGGLQPWSYGRLLANDPEPFEKISEMDSVTVSYEEPTPIIGVALHASHRIRDDLQPKLFITDADRFYEEDPWTERFLGSMLHNLTANASRYEVDVNRGPDVAIYSRPELAWGQQVWQQDLGQFEAEFSLEKWYELHTMVDRAVADAIYRYGYAIVFDIHSYNYQRHGAVDWRNDGKPVINLGTRHLQLDDKGQETVAWVMDRLRHHTVMGEPCLVQENGVFYGGYLNRRLAHFFGPRCITLSLEYKKVYMDERTGHVLNPVLDDLVAQLDTLVRDLGSHLGVPVRDRPRRLRRYEQHYPA